MRSRFSSPRPRVGSPMMTNSTSTKKCRAWKNSYNFYFQVRDLTLLCFKRAITSATPTHSNLTEAISTGMSMAIDSSISIPPKPLDRPTTATILCCNCGAPIDGTKSAGALCYDCIKLTVDVSEGIQREATLHTCRDCERWLQPPSQWISAAPESRELLALCLRKLKGLSRVRIIDANFLWTEPHCKYAILA